MKNLRRTAVILFAQCALLARVAGYHLLPRASPSGSAAAATPVSVAPSQNWDGDDGPWSSFTIQVGTPVQDVRVFISSNNAATWVVLPTGCNAGDSNCLNSRGLTFNPKSSSTWNEHGNYELSTEQNLNLSSEATFGNDTLGLGIQGSGGPVLQNQVIGGFTDENFYLGYFGVNSAVINFTNTQSQPSYITNLKNQNLIPSISFGYTAGNQYRLKQVLGSLTLGGYDAGRFTPNAKSFPFAEDSSRSLMLGVQSISSTSQGGESTELLASGNGFMAYVDSTVAQIWLPLEACQAFEKAFGITFDEVSELYLVNTSLHTQLQAQDSSVTFVLGSGTDGGEIINITLPYASFDLLVEPPTPGVANSTRYFPLRRAANESQYTIGRTFLQEAYLTVDWERRNFSISQCLFDDNMQENLVPIMPNPTSSTSSSSSNSSTGKTVGIAVAVVVVVLVVAGALGWFFWRKHQKSKAAKDDETPPDEIGGQNFAKRELDTGNDNQRYEMQGSEPVKASQTHHTPNGWVNEKANYPGDRSGMAEVEGGEVSAAAELAPSQRHQMHGFHEMYDPSAPLMAPVELLADLPRPRELQGSSPTSPASSRRPSARSPVSNPGSPSSQSLRPRSWKRFSRPQPSRKSTQESIPSQVSAPTPPPKPSRGPSSSPSTDFFSPVSRQGTGIFPSDNEVPASPRADPILSPMSPDSPRRNRTMFQRLRGGLDEPSQ